MLKCFNSNERPINTDSCRMNKGVHGPGLKDQIEVNFLTLNILCKTSLGKR